MVGKALRYIRIFHDITLKDFCEGVDITQGYVSEIENGKRPATIEIIEKYADSFGLYPSQILRFSELLDNNIEKLPIAYMRNTINIFVEIIS